VGVWGGLRDRGKKASLLSRIDPGGSTKKRRGALKEIGSTIGSRHRVKTEEQQSRLL